MPESVSLVAAPRPDPVWVLADAGQLEQVVVTLALRARDVMPAGGVLKLATIAVEGADDAPPCVGLEVVDTGEAPETEALRRSLDPSGPRLDDERDTRLTGAAALVRASGGRIEAARHADGTTRIRALWPLAVPPGGRPEAAGGAPRGRETVLFVEDDGAMRDLVTAMLSRLGYEVFTVGGADEALHWLGDHPGGPRLLLADLVLPGMSGRELVQRAREARPDLRVLLTSGYAASPGATEVAPGLPFLPKPFTRDMLARRVRETLDAPPAGAGGASV
jgi:CheY-like chemotaxis protein